MSAVVLCSPTAVSAVAPHAMSGCVGQVTVRVGDREVVGPVIAVLPEA